MEIIINGKISADPKDRILAIEAITRAICEQTDQDPADGVMMLLTAAVHLSQTYSRTPVAQTVTTLAGCLGHAVVAADDFFKLKTVGAPTNTASGVSIMADVFSPDEIRKCVDAMKKPGPIDALKLIASGRAIIEISRDGRDIVIDSIDGKPVRDPDFPERKMGLAGAWPLYRAGMIDRFGILTEAGRTTLKSNGGVK